VVDHPRTQFIPRKSWHYKLYKSEVLTAGTKIVKDRCSYIKVVASALLWRCCGGGGKLTGVVIGMCTLVLGAAVLGGIALTAYVCYLTWWVSLILAAEFLGVLLVYQKRRRTSDDFMRFGLTELVVATGLFATTFIPIQAALFALIYQIYLSHSVVTIVMLLVGVLEIVAILRLKVGRTTIPAVTSPHSHRVAARRRGLLSALLLFLVDTLYFIVEYIRNRKEGSVLCPLLEFEEDPSVLQEWRQ
jgi:hypothetical protein